MTEHVEQVGRVGPQSHLTLHYRVSLPPQNAEVISTFGGRPATLQLGHGHLAESLEQCLIGLAEGARERFTLPAGQGYGERVADLVQAISRRVFDANAATRDGEYVPGDVVDINGRGGERVAGVLKSIDDTQVVIDFNHPLAGQAIVFEVHVLGVL